MRNDVRAMIQGIVGVRVLSLRHGISTLTDAKVVVFYTDGATIGPGDEEKAGILNWALVELVFGHSVVLENTHWLLPVAVIGCKGRMSPASGRMMRNMRLSDD